MILKLSLRCPRKHGKDNRYHFSVMYYQIRGPVEPLSVNVNQTMLHAMLLSQGLFFLWEFRQIRGKTPLAFPSVAAAM